MKCSQNYNGDGRIDVGNRSCDKNCMHWEKCLEELNLPKDFVSPVWKEEDPTQEDIMAEKYHTNCYLKKDPSGRKKIQICVKKIWKLKQ